MKDLDKAVKFIWERNIKDDYNNGLILNEDTLKNALYYHLRTFFKKTYDFIDFCIFTECNHYGFSDLNSRPDMIVVDKDTDKIVAIFELKYKSRDCPHVEDLIYYDFYKIKEYMKRLDTVHSECQYYIGAITLGEFNRPNWLDGRSKWAVGKVAELIAYEPDGIIKFQVVAHNE